MPLSPMAERLLWVFGPVAATAAIRGGVEAVKSRTREKERATSLAASAVRVLTPDNFGNRLPDAQAAFRALVDVAPSAMSNPVVAESLVSKALRKRHGTFDAVLEATGIERNVAQAWASRRTGRPDVAKAINEGLSQGATISGLLRPELEFAGVIPSAASMAAGPDPLLEERIHGLSRAAAGSTFVGVHQRAPTPEEMHTVYNRFLNATPEELKGDPRNLAKLSSAVIADLSPDAVGRVLGTQYCLLKTAAPTVWSNFPNALMAGIAAAGASALIGAVPAAIGAIHNRTRAKEQASQLSHSFDSTLKGMAHSQENDVQTAYAKYQEDPVRVRTMAREAFSVLANVAPSLASHPHVARSYIARVINTDGNVLDDVLQNYSRIQDVLNKTEEQRGAGVDRFLRSFTAFGGGEAIKAVHQGAINAAGQPKAVN